MPYAVLALPAPEVDLLRKFAGMLGSDAPGERAVAALKATALLREHGATWGELVTAAFRPAQTERTAPSQEPPRRSTGDHRGFARWALTRSDLSPWEREFLSTLACQATRPSPKQADVLERIDAKLKGRRS